MGVLLVVVATGRVSAAGGRQPKRLKSATFSARADSRFKSAGERGDWENMSFNDKVPANMKSVRVRVSAMKEPVLPAVSIPASGPGLGPVGGRPRSGEVEGEGQRCQGQSRQWRARRAPCQQECGRDQHPPGERQPRPGDGRRQRLI